MVVQQGPLGVFEGRPCRAQLLVHPLSIVQIRLWLAQIVSMEDDMTMPEGWGSHAPPAATPWTDASIYELHIRDFRYCHTVLLIL